MRKLRSRMLLAANFSQFGRISRNDPGISSLKRVKNRGKGNFGNGIESIEYLVSIEYLNVQFNKDFVILRWI